MPDSYLPIKNLVPLLYMSPDSTILSINGLFGEAFYKKSTIKPKDRLLDYVKKYDQDLFLFFVKNGKLHDILDVEVITISNKRRRLLIEKTGENNFAVTVQETKKQRKEKKKIVERLRTANKKISNKLKERIELNELKNRIISTASHEFKTPLAGILSSQQLVKRYLAAEQQKWNEFSYRDKIENHFHKIEETVTSLNIIVEDFLSLSKIQENKVSIIKSQLDCPSFFGDLVQELQMLAKPNQNITYNHLSEKLKVKTDKNILRNIVNNIVSNSIKYSEEGSKIHLTTKIDKYLYIQIKDNGIGIPVEDQKNIFNRFYRAGNTVGIKGAGLGLNIVKNYVDLLGGKISFKSEYTKGTTFNIKLPIN